MIFLGCLFDRSKEKYYLSKSKNGLSNAVNTFQWNLIEGFNANSGEPIKIFNVLPVGIFPFQYKEFILKSNQWFYKDSQNFEIGCINIPFIKQYQRYRTCRKLLNNSEDKNIIIYSTYYPFLKAVYKLDKSYSVTLIVTDLPEFYDLGKTSFVKRFLRKRNNTKIYKCMERVDKFVLLTEQMKEPLRLNGRPYTVVEGICSNDISENVPNTAEKEKIILYTGTLHRKFGVANLLKAFAMIENSNYRLWLCGSGDAQDEIEKAAREDARIKFFGYVDKKTVKDLQNKATLLVNPRQNNDEFTKYSFPSKTMEYMLSGKPVLMYKLDGIPNEYDKYLYYFDGDEIEQITEKIIEICEKPDYELRKFGKKAQEFVSKEKNPYCQAKKIINLLESIR